MQYVLNIHKTPTNKQKIMHCEMKVITRRYLRNQLMAHNECFVVVFTFDFLHKYDFKEYVYIFY